MINMQFNTKLFCRAGATLLAGEVISKHHFETKTQ